jgi:hypothetical protein
MLDGRVTLGGGVRALLQNDTVLLITEAWLQVHGYIIPQYLREWR